MIIENTFQIEHGNRETVPLTSDAFPYVCIRTDMDHYADRTIGWHWHAAYILSHYGELEFSPAVEAKMRQAADNPKRRQRNARKQLENIGVGTKAQQALQKQREEMKTERREISREQRDAEKQRQFEIRQQKRKEKHRGH